MSRLESSSLRIPSRPTAALLTVGGLALATLLVLPTRHALAGDAAAPTPPVPQRPSAPQAPEGAEVALPPRQAALDAEIHRLERHLSLLRKARTELVSNRPEFAATDEATRRRVEAGPRGLREASRYEASRARALAALESASDAKDAGKAGEASAALDALDSAFASAMRKLEASLDDPAKSPSKASAKSDVGPATGAKSSSGTKSGADAPRVRKKAAKPAGAGAMSGEGDEVADEDAGDDDETDHDE